MNAKRITGSVLGSLLASAALAAGTEPFEPDLEKVSEIVLGFNSLPGWYGKIWRDGRGRLSYGSHIGHCGSIPGGGFSFEEVYTLVAPHLKWKFDNMGEAMQVGFYFGDPSSGAGLFIEDRETMRKLMLGLCDKIDLSVSFFMDKAGFKKLLMTHPLVPGDPPALREDGTLSYDREKYAVTMAWLDAKPPYDDEPEEPFAAAGKETPAEPAVEKKDGAAEDGSASPPHRPWLYVGALALLTAASTLWIVRRKR